MMQIGFHAFADNQLSKAKVEQSSEDNSDETIDLNSIEAVIPVAQFDFYKIIIPSIYESAIQHVHIIKYKQGVINFLSYFDNLFQSSIQTLAP